MGQTKTMWGRCHSNGKGVSALCDVTKRRFLELNVLAHSFEKEGLLGRAAMANHVDNINLSKRKLKR